jgi:hypothetical protein
MKPTIVGLVIAGLYIVFKMALYIAGVQYDVMMGKAAMILLALVMLGIFYSINFYIRNSSTYDWMAAFKKGIAVSLISSVVVGIFIFIYYKVIDPFYLEQLSINEYNRMKTMIPADKMEDFTKSLKERYTANMFAIMTVSIVNIVGLFSSLIVGFLGRMTVKRRKA